MSEDQTKDQAQEGAQEEQQSQEVVAQDTQQEAQDSQAGDTTVAQGEEAGAVDEVAQEEPTEENTAPDAPQQAPVETPAPAPAPAPQPAPAPAPVPQPAPIPAPAPAPAPAADAPSAAQAQQQSTGVSGTVTKTDIPVVPVPVATAPQQPGNAITDAQAVLEQAKKKVSTSGQLILSQLQDYIGAMHPRKPQTSTTINAHQVRLFRLIQNTINNLDEDFRPVFGHILVTFDALKDSVFHEAAVFRHMDNITLSSTDRTAFERLLNLIKMTADVKGRELAARQVNFTKSLEAGITPAGREKILRFFGK